MHRRDDDGSTEGRRRGVPGAEEVGSRGLCLKSKRPPVEQQHGFSVHYRGHFIGKLVPDLIVDQQVIVDPKVVTSFNETHVAQMLGYLNITVLHVALLLNFKHAHLG
ncbi:MAG: GxxExxY protein [Mycobacterium sp.]